MEEKQFTGENQGYPKYQGSVSPLMVSDNFMQYRLESSDVIEDILHYLRGEVWDSKKKVYTPKFEPLCNENGINTIAAILYSHLHKGVFTSDLEEEDILRIAKEVRKAVSMLVALYYKEFGIDEKYRDIVIQIIDHNVYVSLRRALRGGERDLLSKTVQRVEQFVHRPERKSLFSIFKSK